MFQKYLVEQGKSNQKQNEDKRKQTTPLQPTTDKETRETQGLYIIYGGLWHVKDWKPFLLSSVSSFENRFIMIWLKEKSENVAINKCWESKTEDQDQDRKILMDLLYYPM